MLLRGRRLRRDHRRDRRRRPVRDRRRRHDRLLRAAAAAGGGDELQGIKRGIIELADIVAVNKADGEHADAAGRTVAEYRSALRLLRPRSAHWQVPVETVSSLEGRGIDRIWQLVNEHARAPPASSTATVEQAREWLRTEMASLLALLDEDPALARRLAELDRARGGTPAPGARTHPRLRRQLAAPGGS
jgi:LAO/AO transport system kinase